LPSEHGATYATWRLRPDVPTLAERLDALGYDTFATSGNPVVSAATGLARGFQRFDETYADGAATAFTWTELRRALYPVRGSVAERQTNAAVEVLSRRRRRPAFVFVNYFEPHGPYEPEDGRRRALPNVPGARPDRELIAESGLADLPMLVATQLLRWSPADLRRERQLYDAEVASVDAELSRLLAAAGSHGDRPALVVLTSDHGEHFGEQGRAGHMFSLGEALLHVPLLISDPRRPELAGRRLPRLVSLRELPGFLLGAARGEPSPELGQAGLAVAELDVPHDLLDGFAARHAGVDLSALRRGGRALRREGWKLLALDGEPAPRLFDLAAGGEERDVAALEPALAAEAARELDRLIPPRLAGGRERAPLDPATKERLRALGYLR
jgi:arylsulfatase A-like enzyme